MLLYPKRLNRTYEISKLHENALTHTERFDAACATRRDRRMLTFVGKKKNGMEWGKRIGLPVPSSRTELTERYMERRLL